MAFEFVPAGGPVRGGASLRIDRIPESSTVAIADLASQMRRDGLDVVDMSAGRAAEHSPRAVCEAAITAMRGGRTHQTEARGIPEYLDAAAAKLNEVNGLGVDPARNVIATLGCKQGLVLALLSTIDFGDEVIVEEPCFVSYAPTIELFGGVPVGVPTDPGNRHTWSEDALEAAVTARTRAILLCSPHNPAGTVHTRGDLEAIANVARRHDLTVIADEIYEAVCWGGRRHLPIYSLPGMRSRTIGLMGMTKTYSMGGWRIGYAYAAAHFIEAMTRAQQHLMTCASSFGQVGAARALRPDAIEAMGSVWRDWESRCEYVSRQLDAIDGLSVDMPEGGFYVWVDISATGLDSREFCMRLVKERQVAAVPGVTFGASCDHRVRMTCVRAWDELEKGVSRIADFVGRLVLKPTPVE